MIGILCATPEELHALQARLGLEADPVAYGPTRVWRGLHRGCGVAVALAGMGKVNAAAAATLLLGMLQARVLIFSGVAGGLDPELPVGAVVLGAALAIHDYGMISDGRFTPTASGVMPIGAPRLEALSPVSPDVRANLAKLADRVADQLEGPVRLGGIVTADYFLNCAVTRAELQRTFGAEAIDMESGAVSQVAEAWGAPLYVIRTLSDLAGEDSRHTYFEMAQMAAHNAAACVMELLDILDPADVRPN
jgi:adenosylhomocysteine nucleosidase